MGTNQLEQPYLETIARLGLFKTFSTECVLEVYLGSRNGSVGAIDAYLLLRRIVCHSTKDLLTIMAEIFSVMVPDECML